VVPGWVFVRVSGWLAVACRVVRGGSRWGGVAWARGGSWAWVVGWLSLSQPVTATTQFFFFFSQFARSA
jgi:hypothetical protein